MPQTAQKIHGVEPRLEYGRVTGGNDSLFAVGTDLGEVEAERAASCLIDPNPGDDVLLSLDESGTTFILAVLRQNGPQAEHTRMVFDRPVDLAVPQGGLTVTTKGRLTLGSRTELALAAPVVAVQGDHGLAAFDRFSFVGRTVTSRIESLKSLVITAEEIVQRLTQKLTNAFRYVKEHEEVQTGSSRHLVEGTLSVHAKNAHHMSEELTTIQAEQIHLG